MSAGGAFGGNTGVRPVPPEKGVFPLDHMHLCDLELDGKARGIVMWKPYKIEVKMSKIDD